MNKLGRVAVVILLCAAFGCSGDDDGGGEAADTATGSGETVTVDIGDFVFDPTPVTISVGQSVVWENVHDQAHTSSGNGDQTWDSGPLAPGESSEPVTFDEAGTFTYLCGLHPFMEGTVEVEA